MYRWKRKMSTGYREPGIKGILLARINQLLGRKFFKISLFRRLLKKYLSWRQSLKFGEGKEWKMLLQRWDKWLCIHNVWSTHLTRRAQPWIKTEASVWGQTTSSIYQKLSPMNVLRMRINQMKDDFHLLNM